MALKSDVNGSKGYAITAKILETPLRLSIHEKYKSYIKDWLIQKKKEKLKLITYGTKYSRKNQEKFVEDSL